MSTLEEKVDKNFEGRKIREFLKEKMGLSSRLIKGASIDKSSQEGKSKYYS